MANNIGDLFSNLLSNPEALKNVKDALGGIDDISDSKTNNADSTEAEQKNADSDFLNNVVNMAQNSDLIKKISSAYSTYSDNSAHGVKLLDALAPYLNQKRAGNLEKVKVAVKLSNALTELNKK